MDADYKLLYDYYLSRQKQYRQETEDLLLKGETGNFGHGTAYLIRKEVEIPIGEDLPIGDVIKELQRIKDGIKYNHSTPVLSSYIDYKDGLSESDESVISVCYYEYSVSSEKSCEGIAKSITDSAIWKMKHQSNGKDAKAYQKRLDELKRTAARK